MKAGFDYTQLSGTWHNELGSIMTLTADKNGGLTGTYNSAVGEAEDAYILTGRFDTAPLADEGVALGWAVSWKNDKEDANSATTWSGQFFPGDSEGDAMTTKTILTQWLLTSGTKAGDVWESTLIGHDEFVPEPPNEERIARAKAASFASPRPEHIIAKKKKYGNRQ
ncbi:avidin family protein [Favolaschia claudopus]|uniref:Avidin family protein n=1 Tax=Favolaschia claudopus TaxID=2862362 RepID=A0AAV9ZH00_9AGAR